MRLCSLLAAAIVLSSSLAAHADSIYALESTATGTAVSFTIANNGLNASFSGSGSVCASGGLFTSLSGNVLIQGLCNNDSANAPLNILFSHDLTSLSFDFGTNLSAGTFTVDLFENGAPAGVDIFKAALDSNGNGEGFAPVQGVFNSVSLTASTPDLAVDNLDAVVTPEPSSLILLATGAIGGLGAIRRRLR